MNVRVALILGLLLLCAGAALALLFSPKSAVPIADADFAVEERAGGARRPASLMPAKPTGAGHARVQHYPTTADQYERAVHSRDEHRTVISEESSSSFSWGEFFGSGQGESFGSASGPGDARSAAPQPLSSEQQKTYGIGSVGSGSGGGANGTQASADSGGTTSSTNGTNGAGTTPVAPPPPIEQSPIAIQSSAGGYTNGLTGGNYKVNVSLGLTSSEVTGVTGGSYKVKVNAQGQIAR